MTLSDLTSLYAPALFEEGTGSFTVHEKNPDAKITDVTITAPDLSYIVCRENLWSASERLYCTQASGFDFRKKCDGFALCDLDGQHYLIWIELKSGSNEVFKKALHQITSCYTKAKSYLRDIATFQATKYKEFGIVVSSTSPNDPIDPISMRRQGLASQEETMEAKYRRQYKRDGFILLQGSDMKTDALPLSKEITFSRLPVVYYQSATSALTIDLKDAIKTALS